MSQLHYIIVVLNAKTHTQLNIKSGKIHEYFLSFQDEFRWQLILKYQHKLGKIQPSRKNTFEVIVWVC